MSMLPPSSAVRRVVCPGSRALEAQYQPNQDSEQALEGKTAHWVAAEMLRNMYGDKWLTEIKIGNLCPNGGLVTQEMIEGGELYRASVVPHMDTRLHKSNLHIEEPIDISIIHPECRGTPDAWHYNGTQLIIWDYKFGHKFVEVFENWQLVEYAAGIFGEIKNITAICPVEKILSLEELIIIFVIVQPRSYHSEGPVRKWETTGEELKRYFSLLRTAECAAMAENARCTPSPECSNCNARHVCKALQQSALNAVDESTHNVPHELTPTALGNELRYLQRALKLLEARKTGLEQQAVELLQRGERIPHFSLQPSNGRLLWTKPVEEIVELGELMGVNLLKPPQVITPKQAIDAKIPVELVNKRSTRKAGEPTLIADDPRKTSKLLRGTHG